LLKLSDGQLVSPLLVGCSLKCKSSLIQVLIQSGELLIYSEALPPEQVFKLSSEIVFIEVVASGFILNDLHLKLV
jgi:hypothetical protein